jgi:hypothetical protein
VGVPSVGYRSGGRPVPSLTFWLGVPEPSWLSRPEFEGIPMFASATRLQRMGDRFAGAVGPVTLDSGGFKQLQMYGRWTESPFGYAERMVRHARRVGTVVGIAPQDWMCEDLVVNGGRLHGQHFVGTRRHLDPRHEMSDDAVKLLHQRFTVRSYLDQRHLIDDRVFPVLQGDTLAQYDRCANLYLEAGVDLRDHPVVGLGSVCRRQSTEEIEQVVRHCAGMGLRLHGFGVKTNGLARYGRYLTSADSMAWSFTARRERIRLPGHPHQNCASCPEWALMWRDRMLTKIGDAI